MVEQPPFRLMCLVTVAVVVACGSEDERPPPLACDTDDCITHGPPSRTTGSSPRGDAGVDEPADAGPSVSISGDVRVFADELFVSRTDFLGDGLVGAEGPAGRVEGQFAGAAYTLEGVLPDDAVWADVQPVATSLDVMTTIQRVDSTVPVVNLAFMQVGTMEDIAAGLLAPIALDDARGHAVLTFVDASGSAVSGIAVTSHSGDVAVYDTGTGLFRDDQTETTAVGRAVVLNAQALGFPGSVSRFSFAGAASGSLDVKLAQGAVTLVTVEID